MMDKQKHYFETVEWNRVSYNADQSFFNPKTSTHHFSHFDSPMPVNHYVGANNNRTHLENKNSGRPVKKTGHVIGPIEEKLSRLSESGANSNEESSNELNSKKRKAIYRGKSKADGLISDKGNEDENGKRSKPTSESGVPDQKCNNNEKAVEPFKDYIHVRARRGQATDSHSLAERVRREKIGERMKLLQDLVPGCNKVTGKALMLDEIINYVESLQRQVEFLSMKLASVNPGQDENLKFSKDIFRQSANISPKMYPSDSSSAAFYNHQSQQSVQQLHNTQCFVDSSPLNAHNNMGVQLLSGDEFTENLPQFPVFGEDDLHRIVQMGWPESNQP